MRRAFVLAVFSLGCAGAGEAPEPRRPVPPRPASELPSTARAFESVRFASVPAGTFGPYVADAKTGGVALWASSHEKGRAWFGVAFDTQGNPRGAPQRLAKAPDEVGLAMVEPSLAGFTLLGTHESGPSTYLDTLELDAHARARAQPLRLSEVSGEVVWIDLVTTSKGSLALWGVKSPEGADLFAALVGGEKLQPAPIVKGARAWQAAALGSGAAVGVVAGGKVFVQTLDEHGAPATRVAVTQTPTASAALDMVPVGADLLLAWSDEADGDAKVQLAAVDRSGKLLGPPKPLPTLGDHALVRLVPPHPGSERAYLAWESLLDRPAEGRALVLAPVSRDGSVGEARATLDHAAKDGSMPELAATASGLAALTLAKACSRGKDCKGAPLLPTYVELDAELRVTASEPLTLSSLRGDAPDLAWGLSCNAKPCRVLAAQAVAPTPVWAVKAVAKPSDFVPAARRAEKSTPPRVAALELLAKTDMLSDVALTKLGQSSLAAWVTYFDPAAPWERLTKPAPDGKLDPVRALLQVRAVPDSGAALAVETISLRARSLGGVALAPAQSAPAEALLGWTAIDFKQPQVFLTVLDEKGKKLRQRMLTRAPGEKSDVALAGLADGWLLAWVDERSGDAELYAARVNRQLMNVGPEKRITNAAGAASDVALLVKGQAVLAAWSDARDKERPGVGDIYVASLKSADASISGGERLVAKTPKHSRSPALAPKGDGALLAWIEESPSGSGEAEARIVEIAADGAPAESSSAVELPGPPSALALDCRDDRCRVLVALQRGGASELWVAEWPRGKAVRLMSLSSPAPLTIAPGFFGREALLADGDRSQGRARRVLIDWK